MQLLSTLYKHRNSLPVFATLTILALLPGCSQPADDNATAVPPEQPPVASTQAEEVAEPTPTAPSSDGGPSFEEYALPIPCRRTSDARESTSSGKYKNVIVFACRSHDVASAADAIRTEMQENGYIADEKVEAQSTTLVVRKQGTYKTTLRVLPDRKTDPAKSSIVRVQWFSND